MHTIGVSNQANYTIKHYPKFSGITTYFITGNHDLSFYKRAQIDIGEMISQKRPDLIYLGQEQADVRIGSKGKTVVMRLMHPGKGTSYAISYKSQKIAESLSGGEKPSILVIGHYHKAEYIFYRNIHIIQAGTLEDQTSFMQRNFISAHRGFWIVEMKVPKVNDISRFKTEFIPFYV